ncbi:hypothetical protein HG535_0A03910 [Zygotorulaspora mrakii]|uniref:Rho-GAP domain-containing protein n=1 Tax=Zygotorulaspora mrakii TaxID=42260 RepID=A0A7H9AY01_ZYGMR|nr:uncharacterized protein HG535_0A03910 [Zygotorulaspora mrakii]QLG70452.1 hypothetical protein HG535_0A03910 [Zygotorulaspora mrakii]
MENASQKTLELLAQYDNHTSERDKAIEHIERRVVNEDMPTYDDLFKENVKLKLQLKEQETEIEALKSLVQGMRSSKLNANVVTVGDRSGESAQYVTAKKELLLPPRSADREKNSKNLSIPIPGVDSSNAVGRVILSSTESSSGHTLTPQESLEKSVERNIKSPMKVKGNMHASKSDVSPAASVTYKTSRITIASPNSPGRSVASSRVRSPQSANRVTAVINNHVHSPLRSNNESEIFSTDKDSNDTVDLSPLGDEINLKSPLAHINALKLEDKAVEFSPSSKQNLNSFADFLEDTFKKSESDLTENLKGQQASYISSPTPTPVPPSLPFPSITREREIPTSMKLGSPVILNRKEQDHVTNSSTRKSSLNTSLSKVQLANAVATSPKQTLPSESPQNRSTETAALFTGSLPPSNSNAAWPHAGSFNSTRSPNEKSTIPLFVQPEDFGTIKMRVLSTLYHETESNFDEPQVLFSVIDRKSQKEMFKFSKTIRKIYELDVYLKPRLSSLSLPALPDKQLLESLAPSKVDERREVLAQYFFSIFSIPNYPPNAALRIAQFMSTDTVMNPVLLGDTVKEGSLLMRRPKTLGSAGNWRARYGILGGDVLTLFDKGQVSERIRLKQSTIELLPNLPEDKHGTKNGFVINEHRKSGLSNTTKYFLCAETSKEREIWVSAISEFIFSASIPPTSTITSTNAEGNAVRTKIDNGSVDQIYVTDLTVDSGSQSNEDNASSVSHEVDNMEEYEDSKESKEIKRLKMRSFFPFKKITSNALNMMYDDADTIASQDSDPKFSDNSIAKSLENMNLSPEKHQSKVFGSPLEDCLKLSSHTYLGKYEIPSVVYRCLEFLYKNRGIQEEGLFRLSGSSALIKSLQEQFDTRYDVDLFNYNKHIPETNVSSSGTFIDVNTVSGLLKLYLRRLPHSIFGDEEYASFKYITDQYNNDTSQIAYKFRDLIRSGGIPEANVSLMYCLFELLLRIQENQRYNKMSAKNLCIVFSPTLNVPVTILRPLIIDFACIFQDGSPVEQEINQDVDVHIPQI